MALTENMSSLENSRMGLAPACAAKIRSEIFSGRFHAGQQLPSEAELAAEFAVSRDTIRSAVTELCAEMLLEKRRGLGTFVLDRALFPSHGLERLTGLRNAIEALGKIPGVVDLCIEQREDGHGLPGTMHVGDTGSLTKIDRTWTADGQPVVHSSDWIPQSVLPYGTSLSDFGPDESLSARLQDLGLSITGAVSWFQAVHCGPYANCLDLSEHDPVLHLTQLHYGGRNAQDPVLYSDLHWNGNLLPLHLVRRSTS